MKIGREKCKKLTQISVKLIPGCGNVISELLGCLWDMDESSKIDQLREDYQKLMEMLKSLSKEEKIDERKLKDSELKKVLENCVKIRKREYYNFWDGYVKYHDKKKKSNSVISMTAKEDTINYVRLKDSVFYLEQILSFSKGIVKLGMRIKDPSRFDEIYAKKEELEKKSGIVFDWSHKGTQSRLVASVIVNGLNEQKHMDKIYETMFKKVYDLLHALVELDIVKKERVYM